jgi:hypothetical protein
VAYSLGAGQVLAIDLVLAPDKLALIGTDLS